MASSIDSKLVLMCIEAASKDNQSVEIWRRQRRTLARLPTPIAQALLHRLLRRRLLSPSLLEVFKNCIEEIDLKGERNIDAEWMAYLGGFPYLRALNLSDCKGLNNSALWALTGMTCLKELDLSRCSKITDAGIPHVLSIPYLEKLCLSETGLSADGVVRLSCLLNLTVLDLGGLPVTDSALRLFQVLQLEYLDLWGSKISNNGAAILKCFPKLNFLNLAWTSVTNLPDLPSITCLNMSGCTIYSIFEGGNEPKAPLSKLLMSGATFVDVHGVFSNLDATCLSVLDISGFPAHDFYFLSRLGLLEHLDLSFSRMEDNLIESVANMGENLRYLNLNNTRVSSSGIAILAGNVPNLDTLCLSHTAVDDAVLSFVGIMPALRVINLSNTNIKGFAKRGGPEPNKILSLTALQYLEHLESLNLEGTRIKDECLHPLSSLRELSHLFLKSDFLTDTSLRAVSSIPKLKVLGILGAVLTNTGLNSFEPPTMLQTLDLRGCWLLTEGGLLAFCKKHPRVDLRHEIIQIPADKNVCDGSSPLNGTAAASKFTTKKGKISLDTPKFRKMFVDERIKYSREELLLLKSSPLYGPSLHDKLMALPKMLVEE